MINFLCLNNTYFGYSGQDRSELIKRLVNLLKVNELTLKNTVPSSGGNAIKYNYEYTKSETKEGTFLELNEIDLKELIKKQNYGINRENK